MNKLDLINAISAHNTRMSGPALTKAQIDAVLDGMGTVARHHLTSPDTELTIPGIGKLVVSGKAARTGRNPKTGADIDIPAHNVVKFRACQALKESVK